MKSWIAHRALVVEALKDRKLNVRLYRAYSTALARLDNQEVHEGKLADYFFARLADKESSPATRLLALQLVPAKHPGLTLDFLRKLVAQEGPDLQLEATRALASIRTHSGRPSCSTWLAITNCTKTCGLKRSSDLPRHLRIILKSCSL